MTGRIVVISQRINNATSGARAVSERNYRSVLEVFGEGNVILIPITKRRRGFLQNWSLRLRGFLDGASEGDLRASLQAVRDPSVSHVLLDSSYFGLFAARIRRARPDIKLVTFFHDVLVHWWSESSARHGLRYLVYAALYTRSERLSCANSDMRITMTLRDADMLGRLYGPGDSRVIPLSIEDGHADHGVPTGAARAEKPVMLFVGTDYRPNVEGVSWFIEQVTPFIDAELRIVGAGMERHRPEWERPNVAVVGRVPELGVEYAKADAVVIPLFSGSGMKVKTAEAIMHGKVIFATTEALVGYTVDGVGGIHTCDTAQAFIAAILSWMKGASRTRFSEEIRKIYLSRHSPGVHVGLMRDAMLGGS